MNPNRTRKILLQFLAVSIIFVIGLSSIGNSYAATLENTSVNVLPAKLIWEKIYGGAADDRAFYALPTGDGYLVVGSTRSIVANTTVGWVLRLDYSGNAIWNKTYFEGSGTEIRYALNLTDGFLLVGNEFLPSGDVNGYVAKIDNQGTIAWKITLGSNGTNELYSAVATQDGFALIGSSSYDTNGDSHAWIVKIDLNGKIIWNKTYGNASDTIARTGVLAPDGTYMVAGYTDPRGESNYDFMLLKINTTGNLEWNETYGGTGTQEAHAMTKASDGYVIVGDTQSAMTDIHAWVVKVDFNGNMLWSETVGGNKADSPAYITPAKNGGYLVAGFTFSFGAGNRDFWLFEIDDSGQVQWSCTQGDAGYQEAYSVIEAGKNQYIMVGWTDPPGQPSLIGKAQYDFYIVRIDALQSNNGFSSLQIFFYALAISVVAIAVLILVYKLAVNRALTKARKNNRSF